MKATFSWHGMRGFGVAFGLGWFAFAGASSAMAQAAATVRQPRPAFRLLTVQEGRSIVQTAWDPQQPERGARDCSHLVHQIYSNAGFDYPYASSFEIYSGSESFARVKSPHAGDLIVWPGHVGIVVDPVHHSFYSLVRTGLEEQDYQGQYWRSRGRPRFYRYKVASGRILSVAKTPAPPTLSSAKRRSSVEPITREPASPEAGVTNQEPAEASERSAVNYDPPDAVATPEAAAAFEVPASVILVAGNRPPTREEVAEGISELSNAIGSVLRTQDPSGIPGPVVVVEQFRVERVDTKRDHGWARLVVDSELSFGGGAAQRKHRKEKVRWELRRTASGWEAVAPSDRTYIPHDVAVKNLAAQLARLTESDGATEHQPAVLHQESQIADLLSALLQSR